MDLDRRSFLKILGATPLVIAAPALGQIWLPPEQEIIVPAEISKTIVEGNTVCGWVIPLSEMEAVNINFTTDYTKQLFKGEFMQDAIMYFPSKTPIMLLAGDIIERRRGVRQPIRTRFIWRGTGSIPAGGKQFGVMRTWNNSLEILQ